MEILFHIIILFHFIHAIHEFTSEGIYGNRKKSGWPRKTTAQDDNTIKRIGPRSPTSSCKKVHANLLKKGTDVSVNTISRRLSKEFGLKSGKPENKSKLTPLTKRKRLEFSRNHLHWTFDDGGKVLLSDESTFQQLVVRHKHVRRPVGKRFDQKYTIATVKHPPQPDDMGCHEQKWNSWIVFFGTWHHHE